MNKNKTKRLTRRIAKLEGERDAALGLPAKTNAPRSYDQGYGRIYEHGEVQSARTVEF
jgi:hypothetical protein